MNSTDCPQQFVFSGGRDPSRSSSPRLPFINLRPPQQALSSRQILPPQTMTIPATQSLHRSSAPPLLSAVGRACHARRSPRPMLSSESQDIPTSCTRKNFSAGKLLGIAQAARWTDPGDQASLVPRLPWERGPARHGHLAVEFPHHARPWPCLDQLDHCTRHPRKESASGPRSLSHIPGQSVPGYKGSPLAIPPLIPSSAPPARREIPPLSSCPWSTTHAQLLAAISHPARHKS